MEQHFWYLIQITQISKWLEIFCPMTRFNSLRLPNSNSRTKISEFEPQVHCQNRLFPTIHSLQSPIAAAFFLLTIFSAMGAYASIFDNHWVERESIATPSAMKPKQPVTFQSVGKGYRSGVRAPMQIVIRNQSEWEAIWHQHVGSDSNSRPAPAIDFDKEIVVALFLGDKPTGGFDVRISRAEQSNNTLTILYQERSPTPGSMVVQAWTQPFHMVRIIDEVTNAVVFRRES